MTLEQRIAASYSKFTKAVRAWKKDQGNASKKKQRDYYHSEHKLLLKIKRGIEKKALDSDPEFAKAKAVAKEKAAKEAKKAEALSEEDVNKIL